MLSVSCVQLLLMYAFFSLRSLWNVIVSVKSSWATLCKTSLPHISYFSMFNFSLHFLPFIIQSVSHILICLIYLCLPKYVRFIKARMFLMTVAFPVPRTMPCTWEIFWENLLNEWINCVDSYSVVSETPYILMYKNIYVYTPFICALFILKI